MRIAVWNTAFLGDSVLTLPLVRALSAGFPGAEMDFYVRGGLGALYEAQPELSAVYECRKRGSDRGIAAILRQGREISARGYDIWVDAHLSLRSSLMARMSGAPERIGYMEAALSRIAFTRRTSRMFDSLQEIERLLRLAEAAGVPQSALDDADIRFPRLVLPRAAHDAAAELLSPLGGEGPVIGVHPG
ncbi:MAG: lipopolysaccharide heptosyltransferase II, partial [Mailhella sp.]|nr:lipopolysaccharide heptosyltransferase II [Mailhella sp.]